MASKDLLSEYINKILSLQEQQRQLTLSDASLREIATEMGIDEQGWQVLQQSFEDHRTRAQGFMRYRNWDKSIQEFEMALPIRPFDELTLQGLSEAHYYRWQKSQTYADKRQAAVYAEKCLQVNPKNDFSLRIITELGPVAAPQADDIIKPDAKKGAKLALFIGVGAAILMAGILLFLTAVPQNGPAQKLPVLVEEAQIGATAPGEREIPLDFVGNKSAGDLQFLLQESRFREYSKSSSFSLKGYVQAKGIEITRLKLRVELLDKENKRLYEDKMELIGKFDDPVRSLDLMPLAYLKHIRNKKGLYPHGVRLSVLDIEWQNIPDLYPEPTAKNITLDGNVSGLDITISERESQYSEHPKERYVFHKLKLELNNQSGKALSQLKAKVKWFDTDGKTIENQTLSLIEKDQPKLLSGQKIPITISEKISKAKKASDIQGYHITLYGAD